MSNFCFIRYLLDDIWHKIVCNRFKAIICSIIAVAGVAVGVAFFCAFNYGWWYWNRCNFAQKIFEGGFGVLIIFLISYILIFICIALCNMLACTKYLSCFVIFISALYCGANTAALIVCSTVWGVLFAVLISLAEVLILAVTCFLSCCEISMKRSFCESLRDFKSVAFVLTVGFIYKIFAFFVVLKILTAVI